jgi:hypothetical protein
VGNHLQQAAHSDVNRLTSPLPKMILTTYKIDVHPAVTEHALRGSDVSIPR